MVTLRKSSIASTTESVFRLGIVVLTQPLLLMTLGAEKFGQWSVLLAAVMLSAIMDLGIPNAVTVHLPGRGNPASRRTMLSTSLFLVIMQGAVVSIVWISAAAPLYHVLFSTDRYAADVIPALRILGLAVIGRLLLRWVQGWEAGILRYDILARVEVPLTLAQNAGLVLIAMVTPSLLLLSAWLVFTTLASVIVHVWMLRRAGERTPFPRWDGTEARELASFGIGYWWSNLSGSLFASGDRLLVNRFLGAEAVGLYALATSIVGKINEVSALPVRPILPEIARRVDRNEVEHAQTVFLRAIDVNAAFIFVLASAVLWGSGPISRFVTVGGDTATLVSLLRILAFIYALYSLVAPAYYALFAVRQLRPVIFWPWAGTLLTLALIPLLAPLGILKVGWANLAYCASAMMTFDAARVLGLPPGRVWSKHLRPVLAVSAVAVASSWSGLMSLPASIAAFVVTLPLVAWIDRHDTAAFARSGMSFIRLRWPFRGGEE